MFRRTQPPREGRTVLDSSHEARLRALGHLLDERGYDPRGLAILEVADGFEVTGMKPPDRGAAYDPTPHTEHIPAAELAARRAQLRQED